MTYSNISITPGQPIDRQKPHSKFPSNEWTSFCDSYDRIVVVPYRRAKIAIAVAFILQLIVLMATMTLTDSVLPTANLFLIGPCMFGVVAGAALVYMFFIYPRVSRQLQALCQETSERLVAHNLVLYYRHNDVHHDLSDHSIQIAPLVDDIETAVPAFSSEWNPLLQLRSLWNRK